MRSHWMLAALVPLLVAPLAGAHAQRPRAAVSGSVTDATTGRSLEGVTVRFGDDTAVVTDRRGGFQIKSVPVGDYEVRVSRVGYRPKTLEFAVDPDDRRLYLVVALEPLPVELEPVVVRGDTSSIVAYGEMADFYRRKRMGFGRFITRQDIDRRNPFRVTDLLWGVPGTWIRYNAYGQAVVNFRGFSRCQPAVYLDHMRVPLDFGFALDELVQPQDVEGMEVYNGYAMTPAEFWGGCGAIVIWTR